jgi:hypothetical protein
MTSARGIAAALAAIVTCLLLAAGAAGRSEHGTARHAGVELAARDPLAHSSAARRYRACRSARVAAAHARNARRHRRRHKRRHHRHGSGGSASTSACATRRSKSGDANRRKVAGAAGVFLDLVPATVLTSLTEAPPSETLPPSGGPSGGSLDSELGGGTLNGVFNEGSSGLSERGGAGASSGEAGGASGDGSSGGSPAGKEETSATGGGSGSKEDGSGSSGEAGGSGAGGSGSQSGSGAEGGGGSAGGSGGSGTEGKSPTGAEGGSGSSGSSGATGGESPGSGSESAGSGSESPGSGSESPGSGSESSGSGSESSGSGSESGSGGSGTGTGAGGSGTETKTGAGGSGTETRGSGTETSSKGGSGGESGSGSGDAGTSGTEGGSETSGGASAEPFRFFASSSFWNESPAADAPLDPSSSVVVGALVAEVAQEEEAKKGPAINTTSWSVPVYTVPAGQPTVKVTLPYASMNPTLQAAWEAVPLPADAQPAAGTDKHLVVWQPSSDRLWEFWHLEKTTEGWEASWGGAIQNVSSASGAYGPEAWPGAKTSWGASASSLSIAGGLITLEDLEKGTINHALTIAVPNTRLTSYASPAQRTDGGSSEASSLPEGAHLRLNPKLDLAALKLPHFTLMLAEAAQKYGIFVRDTAANVALYAQDPTPTGTNPYAGKSGFYEGKSPTTLLAAFPWSELQLLKMELHS